MRYLTKATVVALGGLSLLFPATSVDAQESKDQRVRLEPVITYERFITERQALRIAETPPKELPVVYA